MCVAGFNVICWPGVQMRSVWIVNDVLMVKAIT